jgi:hypothetical protein
MNEELEKFINQQSIMSNQIDVFRQEQVDNTNEIQSQLYIALSKITEVFRSQSEKTIASYSPSQINHETQLSGELQAESQD